MKVAKLKTTEIQHTSQGIIDNYYKVPDSHVFTSLEDEVTSVETLFVLSSSGEFDYGVFRDSLRDNMVPQWANMMYDDRKKCVQHYRYPADLDPGEFASYFSEADHEKNWGILAAKTRATRLQRLFAAFHKISYRMTETQVAIVYMTSKQMLVDYYYANLPHILFWVQNGSYPPLGIDYTTHGMAQMSGFTQSLMYEILDILVNGNYDNVQHEEIIVY